MDETHQPVKYLGPDDKAMSVKGSVTPAAQFVLCIRTPEKSLLDVIATIKQNVSDSIPQTDSRCYMFSFSFPLSPPPSLFPAALIPKCPGHSDTRVSRHEQPGAQQG